MPETYVNSNSSSRRRGTYTKLITQNSTPLLNSAPQQKIITIAANATSNTASINAVNTANSIILINGFNSPYTSASAGQQLIQPIPSFINSTTIQVSRGVQDGTNNLIVAVTILELNPALIQSVQTGTIAIPGSAAGVSETATLSTNVNTANSIAIYSGTNISTTGGSLGCLPRSLVLTNTNTVTAVNCGTNVGSSIGFTILEFKSGVLVGVYNNSQAFSSNTSAVNTIAIDASAPTVNMTNTLVFYIAAHAGGNFYSGSQAGYISLADTQNISSTRSLTTSVTTFVAASNMQFNPGYIKSKQPISFDITAGNLTATKSINPVNINKAFVNFQFFTSSNSTSATQSSNMGYLQLTDTQTATGTRIGSTGTLTLAGEVIEFY